MKIFILKVVINIFKILSSPFMLLPVSKKITILSRMSNTKTLDISLLEQQLKQELADYKIVTLTDRLGLTLKDKIKYILKTPKYIFNIYTSKLVICDSYIPSVSLSFKKKSVKIIQIWHAMGAYKKFGHSALNTYEGTTTLLAKILKMHNNYDYVIASSEYSKEKFSEAFNINKNKVIISLLPRYSYLRRNDSILKKQLLREIRVLNNKKKNILYAPTFRKSKRNYIKNIIKNVDYNKYNLILKQHGGRELIYVDNKKVYEENRKYDLTILCIADVVITDYSAITFDALTLNKPIYFYVPDYDTYKFERGIYSKIEGGDYYKDINLLFKNLDFNKTLEKKKYINIYADPIILTLKKIKIGGF